MTGFLRSIGFDGFEWNRNHGEFAFGGLKMSGGVIGYKGFHEAQTLHGTISNANERKFVREY